MTIRFLCVAALLAAALPAANDGLYEGFRNPPSAGRPIARWWWNGNQIRGDELIRELDVLKAAGFGGVDINPVGMPVVDRKPDTPGLQWLSPEWNRLLKLAAEEARKRGMFADFIAGTGWPFGAPFVTPEQSLQRVQCTVTQFMVPGRYEGAVPMPNDAHRKLLQLKLVPRNATSMDQVIDAIKAVDESGRFYPGKLGRRLPGGEYLLYAVTLQREFRRVGQGAPGAEGLVLDHYNRQAIEQYLKRISDELAPVFGGRLGNAFRAVFCPSLELGDANWSHDFPAQFQKRRGYSIEPYLPFVLIEPPESAGTPFGEAVRRARYDFNKTQSELMLEFFKAFHEWCHRQGVRSRMQAYGHPWLRMHLLDGYAMPDIPEGDTWLHWTQGANKDGVRYAVWNKYASSGAHLTGRNLISTEAFTNLEGVFQASLAELKQVSDFSFAGGINQFMAHGFNYSPPEAGFPGWVRYGTWFSERNPWWRYIRQLTDYISRVGWMMQQSQPRAEIAILGPTADVWSRPSGLDRELFSDTPWYLHELWEALGQAGYSGDYISPTVLLGATTEDGQLRCGPMRYQTLLLAEVRSLEPDVAAAVARHVERGGRVIFAGYVPDRAPGLGQPDEAVRKSMAAARAVALPPPERGGLHHWLRTHAAQLGPAPMEFTISDDRLVQWHHTLREREIVFLANTDRQRELRFDAVFHYPGKSPWRWDPNTGERSPYPVLGAPNRLAIRLGPLDSLLLVFEPGAGRATSPAPEPDEGRAVTVAGPWNVRLEPVEGPAGERTLPALVDFASEPSLEAFSGTATYRTEFRWDGIGPAVLDLGKVHEISEVVLNGKALGVRWWGRHQYAAGDALRAGRNTLEIKVTNMAFNYCRSLKQSATCSYWVNRSGRKEPLPAGLIGPVRLIPGGAQ